MTAALLPRGCEAKGLHSTITVEVGGSSRSIWTDLHSRRDPREACRADLLEMEEILFKKKKKNHTLERLFAPSVKKSYRYLHSTGGGGINAVLSANVFLAVSSPCSKCRWRDICQKHPKSLQIFTLFPLLNRHHRIRMVTAHMKFIQPVAHQSGSDLKH